MDVLYVVGTGSKHDNVELRWSLRSLEKHGRNLGSVVIAGYPPDFLSDEVKRLHVPDLPTKTHKHVNVLNCILAAVSEGMVNGEFLYSSDDHFLVEDIDLDRYPYWIRTTRFLPDEAAYAAGGKDLNAYRRSIVQTRYLLEHEGYGIQAFHTHAHTHMRTEDALEVARIAARGSAAGLTYGFEPTDLFMNVRMKRSPVEPAVRRDRKAREFRDTDSFVSSIAGLDCFSVSDQAFGNPEFERFMYGLYPERSRFERCP